MKPTKTGNTKLVYIDPNDLQHHPTRKEKVVKYVADMIKGDKFPPVKAYRYFFGDKWIVTDGSHRTAACRLLGRKVLVETKSKIYLGE